MMKMIKTMKKNYNKIFLILYIICAIIIIGVKAIQAYNNDEVVLDNLRVNFGAFLIGNFYSIRNYIAYDFDGIGFLSIFLILHFAIIFREKIEVALSNIKINKILGGLLLIFIAIGFYFLFTQIFKTILPWQIFEAMLLSTFLYFISVVINKLKIKNDFFIFIIALVVIVVILVLSYMYFFVEDNEFLDEIRNFEFDFQFEIPEYGE